MPKKPINQTPKPVPVVSVAHHAERRTFPRPLPVPEVKEGNGGDSEWAMWLEHAESLQSINSNLETQESSRRKKPAGNAGSV